MAVPVFPRNVKLGGNGENLALPDLLGDRDAALDHIVTG